MELKFRPFGAGDEITFDPEGAAFLAYPPEGNITVLVDTRGVEVFCLAGHDDSEVACWALRVDGITPEGAKALLGAVPCGVPEGPFTPRGQADALGAALTALGFEEFGYIRY